MRHGIFGWDLPPGVTTRMINDQFADRPCDICHLYPDDCECHCEVCDTWGDIECCYQHGMVIPQAVLNNAWRLEQEQIAAYRAEEEVYARWASENAHDRSRWNTEVENDDD